MGLLKTIKDITNEAKEQAHGTRLLKGVQSTFTTMENWDERIQLAAMAGFLQLRERLISECINISSNGRIKLAREMQKQANKSFDFDMAGSSAKWLAGAWLESNERSSEQAKQAHQLLNQFAEYVRNGLDMPDNDNQLKQLEHPKQHEQAINKTTDRVPDNLYFSFEEWYNAVKLVAAQTNSELAIDNYGTSWIDFIDHEPLIRAFNNNVSPDKIGRDLASKFDISNVSR